MLHFEGNSAQDFDPAPADLKGAAQISRNELSFRHGGSSIRQLGGRRKAPARESARKGGSQIGELRLFVRPGRA